MAYSLPKFTITSGKSLSFHIQSYSMTAGITRPRRTIFSKKACCYWFMLQLWSRDVVWYDLQNLPFDIGNLKVCALSNTIRENLWKICMNYRRMVLFSLYLLNLIHLDSVFVRNTFSIIIWLDMKKAPMFCRVWKKNRHLRGNMNRKPKSKV